MPPCQRLGRNEVRRIRGGGDGGESLQGEGGDLVLRCGSWRPSPCIFEKTECNLFASQLENTEARCRERRRTTRWPPPSLYTWWSFPPTPLLLYIEGQRDNRIKAVLSPPLKDRHSADWIWWPSRTKEEHSPTKEPMKGVMGKISSVSKASDWQEWMGPATRESSFSSE